MGKSSRGIKRRKKGKRGNEGVKEVRRRGSARKRE